MDFNFHLQNSSDQQPIPSDALRRASIAAMEAYLDDDHLADPPGFTFCPTKQELIGYFLCCKIKNLPVSNDVLDGFNVYADHPRSIFEQTRHLRRESHQGYFFTTLATASPKGNRICRKIDKVGTWDQQYTKKVKRVYDETCDNKTQITGKHAYLNFRPVERSSEDDQFEWNMHEYSIENCKIVLCHIEQKAKDGCTKEKAATGRRGNLREPVLKENSYSNSSLGKQIVRLETPIDQINPTYSSNNCSRKRSLADETPSDYEVEAAKRLNWYEAAVVSQADDYELQGQTPAPEEPSLCDQLMDLIDFEEGTLLDVGTEANNHQTNAGEGVILDYSLIDEPSTAGENRGLTEFVPHPNDYSSETEVNTHETDAGEGVTLDYSLINVPLTAGENTSLPEFVPPLNDCNSQISPLAEMFNVGTEANTRQTVPGEGMILDYFLMNKPSTACEDSSFTELDQLLNNFNSDFSTLPLDLVCSCDTYGV